MKTDLSPAAQLAVLLMARWSVKDAKPLTNSEFAEVRRGLGSPVQEAAAAALDRSSPLLVQGLDPDRLNALLDRGLGVFHQLERWIQAGIWAVSWADPDYPLRFKQLKQRAPMLLFGCGNPHAFEGSALACVGSRNASPERLSLAAQAGRACSEKGITLVSGGAKGVDSQAMAGALDGSGRSVGVLADSLLRESTRKPYRDALLEGRLCLVSEVHPEARFEVGNAMARNRLVYACADAALVVECEPNKGGTWAGALDALKEGKVVYVVRGALAERQLAERGALVISEEFACQPERLVLQERPPVEEKDPLKLALKAVLGDSAPDEAALAEMMRVKTKTLAAVLFPELYAQKSEVPVRKENSKPATGSLFDEEP